MKKILAAMMLLLSSSYVSAASVRYLQDLKVDKKATFGVSSSSHAILEFKNSQNANTLTLTSTGTASSFTLILPTAAGQANQSLATDSNGQLFFQNTSTLGVVEVKDVIGNLIQGSTHTHIQVNYDSSNKLNLAVSSSVLLDGQTINVNAVNAEGDVSINRDQKIIWDKDSRSNSYTTNDSATDSIKFFRNGVEYMRFED